MMEGNQLIQEMVPDKYKHRKEKNNKTSTKISIRMRSAVRGSILLEFI